MRDSLKRAITYVSGVVTLSVWVVTSIIFTLLCVPLALLPASVRYDNRFYFFLTTLWNRIMMGCTGIRATIEGREHLPQYPNDPSIIIMNHTSSLDIFLLETIVKWYPHVWLSKAEYVRIPFFNILLKRMHVPVVRESVREALKALQKLEALIKDRPRHAVLFPEGRRFNDGKIHPFFAGFARLASNLDRPVIPIVVSGLEKVMPKGSLLIDAHAAPGMPVWIKIGAPMRKRTDETVNQFRDRVQRWFVVEQEKLQRASS